MANGYCDAKYCRSRKSSSYAWGTGKTYELCQSHNEKFCEGNMREENLKEMLGGE